jgi:hypothetical protein
VSVLLGSENPSMFALFFYKTLLPQVIFILITIAMLMDDESLLNDSHQIKHSLILDNCTG